MRTSQNFLRAGHARGSSSKAPPPRAWPLALRRRVVSGLLLTAAAFYGLALLRFWIAT